MNLIKNIFPAYITVHLVHLLSSCSDDSKTDNEIKYVAEFEDSEGNRIALFQKKIK